MADPESHCLSDHTPARSEAAGLNPGNVVAKPADDQQPNDELSKRLHWQIPDTEILYWEAIPVLRFRDRPTLLFGPLQ